MDSMNKDQYIEHEVQLRVLKETTESRFAHTQKLYDQSFASMQKKIDADIMRLDHKINWLIGICLTSIVIPQLLRMINFS
jgi:hypothetical protein